MIIVAFNPEFPKSQAVYVEDLFTSHPVYVVSVGNLSARKSFPRFDENSQTLHHFSLWCLQSNLTAIVYFFRCARQIANTVITFAVASWCPQVWQVCAFGFVNPLFRASSSSSSSSSSSEGSKQQHQQQHQQHSGGIRRRGNEKCLLFCTCKDKQKKKCGKHLWRGSLLKQFCSGKKKNLAGACRQEKHKKQQHTAAVVWFPHNKVIPSRRLCVKNIFLISFWNSFANSNIIETVLFRCITLDCVWFIVHERTRPPEQPQHVIT